MMAEHGDNVAETTDPLVLLPSEIVLRVIEYADLSSVASLTQVTRAWHAFIDETHQDAIYSSHTKAERPLHSKNFDFLTNSRDYSKYYSNLQSWKDLCKRQTLLSRGWKRQRPVTRETTIQIGNDPIWRFRPDFKRRIFLSTSQMGGMNVTDMDSGNLLWRLDADNVRPFAHLEYDNGTAVWDREGDAVEVWKTDVDGADLARGEFRRVAVLEHDRQTRGFQLTGNTLCVVSSEKKGYVYDLDGEPTLLREIDIENGAVGHLDQGADVVAYSLGDKGYHFFDKASGASLGVLLPKHTDKVYHIVHPTSQLDCRLGVGSGGRASDTYPPQFPGRNRTVSLQIQKGELGPRNTATDVELEEDEWGAGMLDGDMFAGVSRGGRIFVCSDWRKALASTAGFKQVTANLECDSNGTTFDLGGWLAIRSHKIMFETQDRAYIVGLNDDNTIKAHDENPQRPSYAYATSSAAQLAVPVSFMAIYDDCVMSTYTTLRYRQNLEVEIGGRVQERTHVLPTKIIRILSFAPNVESPEDDEKIPDDPSKSGEDALDIPEVNSMRSDLNQLIAMLEGQPDDDDDFMPLEGGLGSDLTDDLGLQQWLENDEWEDVDVAASEGEDGTGTMEESSLEDLD